MALKNAGEHSESKFDYDPFSAYPLGGDIVYKILGIEPDETITRAPSIIISKKVRKDQDVDIISEEPDGLGPPNELENLRNLLKQEDLRDVQTQNIRNKMKKITSSSKNLLNKKVTSIRLMSSSGNDQYNTSLRESHSDISLYKPAVSLRDSAAELGSNIIKKVKRSHQKYGRASSDGVGMAALLVRSMMAAPSLDSIAENSGPTAPSSLKPIARLDASQSGSMISLNTKKHHHHHPHAENKLNISVGGSILDLKATDGNLSSGVSMSSITFSETSSEEDDYSDLGDEVVMIDADTISM